MRGRGLLVAALALAVLMTGCAAAGRSLPRTARSLFPPPPVLRDTRWELVRGLAPDLPAESGIRIWFESDGNYLASAGCNELSGSVLGFGDELRFGGPSMTLMGCAEPQMTRESLLYSRLPGFHAWSLTAGMLTIDGDGADPLVFKSAPLHSP